MESGVTGETGTFAVSRVPVEYRVDFEPAPILHHEMEAGNAVERAKTCALATNFHVQVMFKFEETF